MNVQQSDLIDPALVAEVDLARAAAQEEAGDERVGDYVEHHVEDSAAVTHMFEADKSGYYGWRWAVTITSAGPSTDVTVSEVVLLPGPTALVAPEWIPWQERVQAGDLGVGDLLPSSPDDDRLVPAYLQSDDPAVEEVAAEAGLGRVRVMSRPARLDAADRWQQSEFGPRSDMARSAPAHCGTCGFYLPLGGALRAAFGTCGNEMAPADGHVVHVEYGCGAHSEAEIEQVSPVLVADLIYDDAQLDVEPLVVVDSVAEVEASVEPEAVEAAPESVPVEDVAPVEPVADDAAVVPVAPAEAGAAVADAPAESSEAAVVPEAEPAPDEPVIEDVAPETESVSAEPVVEDVAPEIESVSAESVVDAVAEASAERSEPVSAEPVVEDVASESEPVSAEPVEDVAPVDVAVAPESSESVSAEPVVEETVPVESEVASVEAVAPAVIEPVVTSETSGDDESTARE